MQLCAPPTYYHQVHFDPEVFINDIKDANLSALVSLSDDPNSVYSGFCAYFKFILDLNLTWAFLNCQLCVCVWGGGGEGGIITLLLLLR